MRFRGRDINIVIGAFALFIALVLVFLPVGAKASTSASSGGSQGATYKSQYANNPIVLGPVASDFVDNSAYITEMLKSPEQTFALALANLNRATSFYSVTTGEARANAGLLGTTVQKIKNIKIVNSDGSRYSESVSKKVSGSVGVDTSIQVYARNDAVKYRSTSSVNGSLGANYTGGFTSTTASGFYDMMGKNVCGFAYRTNGNISDYSEMIDNGDGTHSFWVYLDNAAADGYKKEIKISSGYAVNSIKYLRMYVTVNDSNLFFKSIKYDEQYAIKPISKEYVTTNVIVEEFKSFGEYTEIPSANNLP